MQIFCRLFTVPLLFITKNKATKVFQTAMLLNEWRSIQFKNTVLNFKLVYSVQFLSPYTTYFPTK